MSYTGSQTSSPSPQAQPVQGWGRQPWFQGTFHKAPSVFLFCFGLFFFFPAANGSFLGDLRLESAL